jgi:hypothetical protein
LRGASCLDAVAVEVCEILVEHHLPVTNDQIFSIAGGETSSQRHGFSRRTQHRTQGVSREQDRPSG